MNARLFQNSLSNKAQQGATTVEFSIIAAILLIILFGIIEYSLLFMQEHYIANAAREGVRIGVRGNNYDSYKGIALPNAPNPSVLIADREIFVKDAIVDYLDRFYDEDKVRAGTTVTKIDYNPATEIDRVLEVTVSVDNLFTNITPGLLRLFKANSTTETPATIRASAQMELEDQEEFDPSRAVSSTRGEEY